MTPSFKVWQLDISEDDFSTGVEYVAVVDDPAILRMWQSFAAQKVSYQIASQDRKIVMGPLMIPNMPIFRSDDVHGEHYVMYSKESIEKIVRKFFRQKNTGNVNLMHLPAATTNEIYMIESFIIDSSRGITAPKGFDNLPDGTWFGSYQITNDEIWKAVQDGTFRGFSVEGYFTYGAPEDMQQTSIENLISAVTGGTPTQNKYLVTNTSNMGVLSFLSTEKQATLHKLLFGDVPVTPAAAPAPVEQADSNKAMTKDGKQLIAEGGFVQGSKIFIVTEGGDIPAPDGKYELDNGTVCEVTGGTIMNVYEAGAEAAAPVTPAPDPNAQYKALEEKFNAFVAEQKLVTEVIQKAITESTSSFTASFEQVRGDLKNVQEANKLVYEVLQKLEETPAHPDVTKPVPQRQITEAEKNEASIRQISATLKKLNSKSA